MSAKKSKYKPVKGTTQATYLLSGIDRRLLERAITKAKTTPHGALKFVLVAFLEEWAGPEVAQLPQTRRPPERPALRRGRPR